MRIRVLLLGFVAMVVLVLGLFGAGVTLRNVCREVSRKSELRSAIFRKLSAEDVAAVETEMLKYIDSFDSPPNSHVPRQLHDMVKALDEKKYIRRTTLYIPDPLNTNAMWGYTAWRGYYTELDGFARFDVKMDFEKAMRRALAGDDEAVDKLHELNQLTWYKVLRSGKSKAIVRIDRDTKERFKEQLETESAIILAECASSEQ